MTVELDDDFNILAWWKSYEDRFSVLSIMTCDILTYPVSTVTSESTFSIERRVLDEYRSRLDPTTVEALVCLQDWYRVQDREQNLLQEIPDMNKMDITDVL